jgi:hypothetical protein
VAVAMAVLDRLHRRRWWTEPSAMVAAAYEELRSFDLALVPSPAPRLLAPLRWLQDQARLFDEAPGGTLRAFLAWAELRAEGDGRVGGVGPPDPDDDAVRVMTIHGAKGLEFPVVVLAGLERDQADAPGRRPWCGPSTTFPRSTSVLSAPPDSNRPVCASNTSTCSNSTDCSMSAMTRARDHLVLCLHHKQRRASSDSQPGRPGDQDLCRESDLVASPTRHRVDVRPRASEAAVRRFGTGGNVALPPTLGGGPRPSGGRASSTARHHGHGRGAAPGRARCLCPVAVGRLIRDGPNHRWWNGTTPTRPVGSGGPCTRPWPISIWPPIAMPPADRPTRWPGSVRLAQGVPAHEAEVAADGGRRP